MTSIGRYELLGRIGQGGMGTVYKAFDPVLQRVVAVKIISAQLDQNPDARERFFREARAAGQLSHKNIVVVHDLGEQDLQPYLAMEFLEGEDFEMRMRNSGRIPFSRAVKLVTEVCEGLEYAHARGVLHRDIKPANLILTDSGCVKILDFGLARLVSSELTRSQVVMGTANYMSPEQVRGERVDARADIFSVGVVMYELLSGRKAFAGDSIGTIVYKILQTAPEPLHKVDDTIPRQLVDIVDRALAKNREDRYQTMSEILRDLAVCDQTIHGIIAPAHESATRPIVIARDVPKPSAETPAPAPTGWLRVAAWLAAAAVIALIGATWALWIPSRPDSAESAPLAARADAPVTPPPTAAVPERAVAPQEQPRPPVPQPAAQEPALPPPYKSRADEALSRMATARSEADSAGTGGPVARQTMQEALAMERTGRASYKRGQYADAAAQFFQAAALFRSAALAARSETAAAEQQQREQEQKEAERREQMRREQERREQDQRERQRLEEQRLERERLAADAEARKAAAAPVPTPSASPPTTVPAAERAEAQIAALLAKYVSALEGRSIEALKGIWPGLGGATERAIRTELTGARRVRVQLTAPRIDVSGSTATATASRHYELETNDGQRLSSDTETTFSVRKAGDSWVIHDVVHRPR